MSYYLSTDGAPVDGVIKLRPADLHMIPEIMRYHKAPFALLLCKDVDGRLHIVAEYGIPEVSKSGAPG